jgi:CRISPR/Cas system endoribonuclease Cas6 (RAMP superfamily)
MGPRSPLVPLAALAAGTAPAWEAEEEGSTAYEPHTGGVVKWQTMHRRLTTITN